MTASLYFVSGWPVLQDSGAAPSGAVALSATQAVEVRQAMSSGEPIVQTPGLPGYTVQTVPPETVLAVARAGMICSRLQGRLTLGEATCAALDAVAADPATPWAMRQTIVHAIEWQRTSQSMDELAYLLGYGPLEMDVLFRQAMTVAV